jgi:hypothetical protein
LPSAPTLNGDARMASWYSASAARRSPRLKASLPRSLTASALRFFAASFAARVSASERNCAQKPGLAFSKASFCAFSRSYASFSRSALLTASSGASAYLSHHE